MADGREEREEQDSRIEQETRKNREDQFDHDCAEDWTPERVDSQAA